MPTIKMRGGHAPGHARDMFLGAIDAFVDWRRGQPEPTVVLEVDYEPTTITLSRACGLLWNCSDIVPESSVDVLMEDRRVAPKRRTYGAFARAIHKAIQARL